MDQIEHTPLGEMSDRGRGEALGQVAGHKPHPVFLTDGVVDDDHQQAQVGGQGPIAPPYLINSHRFIF